MKKWNTTDIIVTAAIAVVTGLMHFGYGFFYNAMAAVLGPVWVMLFLGFYYLPGTLIGYAVRKPGAALFGSLLSALVQILAGSPFGILALWAGALQGAGAEGVFALTRYRRFGPVVLSLAATASGILAYLYEYLLFSYNELEFAVQAGYFLVRIPSAVILAGLLGYLIGQGVTKSGVLGGISDRQQ
jgi:energy-coupling factor transport system permease protein